jgi:hypothetical protein
MWLVGVAEHDRERVAREWRLYVIESVPFRSHFSLTGNASDPRVSIEAWAVQRGAAVIGYIGRLQVWRDDDPPSWIRDMRENNKEEEG